VGDAGLAVAALDGVDAVQPAIQAVGGRGNWLVRAPGVAGPA
jgi:hypothetical protein